MASHEVADDDSFDNRPRRPKEEQNSIRKVEEEEKEEKELNDDSDITSPILVAVGRSVGPSSLVASCRIPPSLKVPFILLLLLTFTSRPSASAMVVEWWPCRLLGEKRKEKNPNKSLMRCCWSLPPSLSIHQQQQQQQQHNHVCRWRRLS